MIEKDEATTMHKIFLTTFLCCTSALCLGVIAQQAQPKPKSSHIVVANVHITMDYNGHSVPASQVVVWADLTSDYSGSKMVVATPDAGGWVAKQLPVGQYAFTAWAPGLFGAHGNEPVNVTASTPTVKLTMGVPKQCLVAHVVNFRAQGISGVKVSFNNPAAPHEYINQSCTTLANGLCNLGRDEPGTWTVSIPNQSPQQITVVKGGPPLAVQFQVETAIKDVHNQLHTNVQ